MIKGFIGIGYEVTLWDDGHVLYTSGIIFKF